MLWQDRAYVAVAGAGTLLSYAHYLATFQSVTGNVPIHFNLVGTPDRFAAPWGLVLYPLLVTALGATALATTLKPSMKAAMPSNSVEEMATRASLLCGFVALGVSQVYATRIADGSANKLPAPVMAGVYGVVVASIAAILLTKNVF